MISHATWVFYKELYLDSLEHRSKANSDYSENVRKVLDRFTKRCNLLMASLDDVTQLHLTNYVGSRKRDTWRNRPLSNKTINNEIKILNACFSYAGPRERKGTGRRNLGWLEDPPWHEFLPDLDFRYTTTRVHNTFIQLLAETGLVGFTLYMIALLVALWRMRRLGTAVNLVDPELRAYAIGIELALVAFVASSLSGPFAISLVPYLLIALASATWGVARAEQKLETT